MSRLKYNFATRHIFDKNPVKIEDVKLVEYRITDKCNTKCPYCWKGDSFNTVEIDEHQLNKLIFYKKIFGVDYIWLIGGEATISDQYSRVIDFFKSKGENIKLQTNGLDIDKINYLNTDNFTISAHRYIYGNSNRFLKHIEKLNYTPSEINIPYIDERDIEFYKEIEQHFDNVSLQCVAPLYKDNDNYKKCVIEYNELFNSRDDINFEFILRDYSTFHNYDFMKSINTHEYFYYIVINKIKQINERCMMGKYYKCLNGNMQFLNCCYSTDKFDTCNFNICNI